MYGNKVLENILNKIGADRIAVALSGGVDSSYALLSLKEMGLAVEGISLKTFCFSKNQNDTSGKACTSIQSLANISAVCESLDIPFHIINAESIFQEKVINYFVQTYFRGQTPNPCVVCNKYIKWGFLRKAALELGIKFIATGHYAQILYNDNSGRYELIRNRHNKKDQTYMLWPLSQDDLKHSVFPVNNLTKDKVRQKVRAYSGTIASSGESQDICFIHESKYQDYLSQFAPKDLSSGEILDQAGRVIGTHGGFWHYTIGQRRGLGISSAHPLYVTHIDSGKNQVVVGEKQFLLKKEVSAKEVNFVKYEYIRDPIRVSAKVRYSQKDAPGMLYQLDENTIKVVFEALQAEIAPGQSLAVYEGDSLVAGGIIV